MSTGEVIAIDLVRKTAKAAAERGQSLEDACPWPFASTAGRLFKREFIFHKAALELLAGEETSK